MPHRTGWPPRPTPRPEFARWGFRIVWQRTEGETATKRLPSLRIARCGEVNGEWRRRMRSEGIEIHYLEPAPWLSNADPPRQHAPRGVARSAHWDVRVECDGQRQQPATGIIHKAQGGIFSPIEMDRRREKQTQVPTRRWQFDRT